MTHTHTHVHPQVSAHLSHSVHWCDERVQCPMSTRHGWSPLIGTFARPTAAFHWHRFYFLGCNANLVHANHRMHCAMENVSPSSCLRRSQTAFAKSTEFRTICIVANDLRHASFAVRLRFTRIRVSGKSGCRSQLMAQTMTKNEKRKNLHTFRFFPLNGLERCISIILL